MAILNKLDKVPLLFLFQVFLGLPFLAQANIDSSSIFYRLEKDGVSSYLLGTYHRTDISLQNLDPIVGEALLESELLLVELGGMGWRPIHPGETIGMSKPSSLPLMDRLDLSTQESIARYYLELRSASQSRSKALIEMISSSATIEDLLELLLQFQYGEASDRMTGSQVFGQSFDAQLIQAARLSKKNVLSLDNPVTRAQGLHDVLTYADANSLVRELTRVGGSSVLRNLTKTCWLPEGRSLYLQNDVAGVVDHIFSCETTEVGRQLSLAMKYRDRFWWNFIQQHTQRRSTFIAVGLAHVVPLPGIFPGEPSLLERFEEAGYLIEAIPLNNRSISTSGVMPEEASLSCSSLFD